MLNFPIVDSHVHLWDPSNLNYPWLGGVEKLNRTFLLDDYNTHCGPLEVEKMVFLECDLDPTQYVEEAQWVASLADSDPRIEAIVAHAPLHLGDGAREGLERLAEISLVKGVRRLIQSEPEPDFCLQPNFVKGVTMLAEFDYRFDLCIFHPQFEATVELVRRCPEVPFILDHIGKPAIKEGLLDPWRQHLKDLAALDNVVVKISGLVTEADHETWTREQLKPYVDHVIESFGFDRVVYGGDWPVATLATEYPEWVETLLWAVDGASDDELRKLFRDNAIAFYGLT